LLHLACCHTLLVENQDNINNNDDIKYSASSPDELAFVNFARSLNYIFKKRCFKTQKILLEINNKDV